MSGLEGATFELILITDLYCDYSKKFLYILLNPNIRKLSWVHVDMILGLACGGKRDGISVVSKHIELLVCAVLSCSFMSDSLEPREL